MAAVRSALGRIGAIFSALGAPRFDFYRFLNDQAAIKNSLHFQTLPKWLPEVKKINFWTLKTPFFMNFDAFVGSFFYDFSPYFEIIGNLKTIVFPWKNLGFLKVQRFRKHKFQLFSSFFFHVSIKHLTKPIFLWFYLDFYEKECNFQPPLGSDWALKSALNATFSAKTRHKIMKLSRRPQIRSRQTAQSQIRLNHRPPVFVSERPWAAKISFLTQFCHETDVERSKMAENLHAQIFLDSALNGKVKLYSFFLIWIKFQYFFMIF